MEDTTNTQNQDDMLAKLAEIQALMDANNVEVVKSSTKPFACPTDPMELLQCEACQ